jgi:hypothetical protein
LIKATSINLKKIRSVRAGWQIQPDRHDEAKRRLSRLCQRSEKTAVLLVWLFNLYRTKVTFAVTQVKV